MSGDENAGRSHNIKIDNTGQQISKKKLYL